MKKFLLSLLAAFALTASAQVAPMKYDGALKKNPVPATQTVDGPRRALAANQVYFGPYTTDEWTSTGIGFGKNVGQIDMMVLLPVDEFSHYDGADIVGIRFAMAQVASTKKAYIYGLTANGNFETIVEVPVSSSVVGWNTIMLDEPVKLDMSNYTDIALGIDYNQTASNYPISYGGDEYYEHVVYGNLGSGVGYYQVDLSSFGNLSVQAIVEKEFAPNSINLKPAEETYIMIGNTANLEFKLTNSGENAVTSISYTVTRAGETTDEQVYTLSSPITPVGGKAILPIEVVAAEEAGTEDITVAITKVNGEENNSERNVATAKLVTVKKLFEKRVVEEEFTGTGCGWCPRGLQGLANSRAEFGDKFIGIAIHQYSLQSSDAMYISSAKYARLSFGGAPSCYLNRTGDEMDPYYGTANSISDDIRAELSKIAEVGVEITANWQDDTKKKVDAVATVESVVDGNEYTTEFVLVADGLTGSGTGWNQQNYYTNYTASQLPADLAKFGVGGEWGKSPLAGWVFDDIAIASSYNSSKNEAPELGALNAYEPVEAAYTLTMPTYTKLLTAIKNADYDVYAVALVINKATGRIANAAKVKVGEPTGIQNAATTTTTSAIYDLQGRRVNSIDRPGLYIQNGKKIMVK